LVYFLMPSKATTVGSAKECTITLEGLGMTEKMISIFNHDNAKISIEMGEGRVLINGKAPNVPRGLHHFDRIIFGHAYCFRVSVPGAVEEAQRHESGQMLLYEALSEVIPEDSESYQQCISYLTELKRRVGDLKAEAFLGEFRRVVPAVEEANVISQYLRPTDNLHFEIEVMSDLFTYETDSPECMIRLYEDDSTKQRLYKAIKRKFAKRDYFAEVAMKLHSKTRSMLSEESSRCIGVWDWPGFRMRVAHLRDVYNIAQREGLKAVDMSLPQHNPFVQLAPMDVATMVKDAELAPGGNVQESEAELEEQKQKFAAEMEELEKVKTKLQEESKERERKIKALEQENRQLRAAATPAAKPPGAVELGKRLQSAGEDAAAAQKLAMDLLSGLQKMKKRVGGP